MALRLPREWRRAGVLRLLRLANVPVGINRQQERIFLSSMAIRNAKLKCLMRHDYLAPFGATFDAARGYGETGEADDVPLECSLLAEQV